MNGCMKEDVGTGELRFGGLETVRTVGIHDLPKGLTVLVGRPDLVFFLFGIVGGVDRQRPDLPRRDIRFVGACFVVRSHGFGRQRGQGVLCRVQQHLQRREALLAIDNFAPRDAAAEALRLLQHYSAEEVPCNRLIRFGAQHAIRQVGDVLP